MESAKFTDIKVRYENSVARISINRPTKLNAIRIKTYLELISALQAADASPDCHIILLEGVGGQFTAGNDLSDLVGGEQMQLMDCVRDIFLTVANLKKVIVAAVEGVAVGIGTTILLHCDIVVASRTTKFRVPFANLGVGPEGASSVLLPHVIGQKMAREVLFTGRFFSAGEALSWGLINQISNPEKAVDVAQEYIALLLRQPLASLLRTKELMRVSQPEVATVIDNELKVFCELLQTEETRARINGFLKAVV
ncbi:enoyl-CoA hydratase/isomerase family protein [Desulforhopalus singaporensis]|uniref:Enoyl-CoA hydratase/carnithine racemase n=1 Tax=Desulforhopalus singaporensis TaxID=91360 RepID=A0A1H0V7J6_9BACT|nr:enoyl-CoA hydratase-related protein [Desulforhopalus singaporensis]SDP74158.1 Enoyl-CoA hydratase/carnithine racemase [Desulforhopalus singaporensis]